MSYIVLLYATIHLYRTTVCYYMSRVYTSSVLVCPISYYCMLLYTYIELLYATMYLGSILLACSYVRILLHICRPHTTVYLASSYYYISNRALKSLYTTVHLASSYYYISNFLFRRYDSSIQALFRL